MMMIGTVTTTAAAPIAAIGWSNCDAPVKKASVAGTVRAAGVLVNVLANRKSFQAKMKTRIAAVKVPGAASGRITFVKASNGLAPSTWAVCHASHGTAV